MSEPVTREKLEGPGIDRRKFLIAGAAGGAAAAVACVAGCGDGATTPDGGTSTKIVTPKGPVQWAMLLDLNLCTGCKTCTVACKTEHKVPLGVFRREVKALEVGTFPDVKRRTRPWLCNHCDEPPCVTRCPTDAVCTVQEFPNGDKVAYLKRATYKRPDGLVLVDEERCIGCGFCVEDCPYGARFMNPEKKAAASTKPVAGTMVADKCDHCMARVEHGIAPACVQTCPASAVIFGDTADANSEISKAIKATNAAPPVASYGTKPTSRYSGLSAADADNVFVKGKDVKDERCAVATSKDCRASG